MSAGTNTKLATRENAGNLMGECIITNGRGMRTSGGGQLWNAAFMSFERGREGAAPHNPAAN